MFIMNIYLLCDILHIILLSLSHIFFYFYIIPLILSYMLYLVTTYMFPFLNQNIIF